MKGFAPNTERHGFSPDLLRCGLWLGYRASQSLPLQKESANLSGAWSTRTRNVRWSAQLPLWTEWLKHWGKPIN